MALLAGAVMLLANGASAQNAGPPSLSLPASGAQGSAGTAAQAPTGSPSGPVVIAAPPAIPTTAADGSDSSKPGTPAAPVEKTELQGTPFPSMVPGTPRQPPLSDKGMGVSVDQTRQDMNQLNKQTNQRMNEIKSGIGAGNPAQAPVQGAAGTTSALPAPNTSAYSSELQELAALQRNTRLMQARRQEAEAAMAVWGVLYDPRKEDEAAKHDKEVKEKEEKERAAKEQEQALAAVAAAAAKSGNGPSASGSADAASRMELPLPRIVSVQGTNGKLRATLLVPYVGEVTAVPGTSLPGDRRVMSITNDGVTIRDPKMGTLALGYGDSVPSAPPSQANQARAGATGLPALFAPPGFPSTQAPVSPLVQGR